MFVCFFCPGLDLCYGRWDNCKHYLTDCDTDFIPSQSSKMVCSLPILYFVFKFRHKSMRMLTDKLKTADAVRKRSVAFVGGKREMLEGNPRSA